MSREKISINFSTVNTKFWLSLLYNGYGSYLYVNKTQIYKFKAKYNIRWYRFCWGSESKDFTKDEQSEISFNGTVHNFSVDRSSIKKVNILIIHQYLIIKNNIKWSLDFVLLSSLAHVADLTKWLFLKN